jgi:hypothetical protein
VQVEARQLRALPVDRSAFLNVEELARRETAELRLRYEAWRQASRALDNDPSTLVHFNFQDARNLDGYLINRSVSSRATHGVIVGCDWVRGRWPGKRALQFKRPGDQVRLAVPGQFESLTYLAWVRVDSLPHVWNALALTQTFKPGEVHWQFDKQGGLMLSVRQTADEEVGWERVVSAPVITAERVGRWFQLAGVYDGPHRTMTVYVNGQMVASNAITRPLALSLGAMELGNWDPISTAAPAAQKRLRERTNYVVRNFYGSMDEFALLSRPLSPDEIRRQYELGKPRETTVITSLPPRSSPAAKP